MSLATTLSYHSQDSSSSQSDVPIAMCLTQFHCLVMYRDKLEALCVLNDKVVFQEAHTVRVSISFSVCSVTCNETNLRGQNCGHCASHSEGSS